MSLLSDDEYWSGKRDSNPRPSPWQDGVQIFNWAGFLAILFDIKRFTVFSPVSGDPFSSISLSCPSTKLAQSTLIFSNLGSTLPPEQHWARIPVRHQGDWAFAMGRLPVRFQETEQSRRGKREPWILLQMPLSLFIIVLPPLDENEMNYINWLNYCKKTIIHYAITLINHYYAGSEFCKRLSEFLTIMRRIMQSRIQPHGTVLERIT